MAPAGDNFEPDPTTMSFGLDLGPQTASGWSFMSGIILGDAVSLAAVLRLVLDTSAVDPGVEVAARAAIKVHNETVAVVEEWRAKGET